MIFTRQSNIRDRQCPALSHRKFMKQVFPPEKPMETLRRDRS